MMHPKLVKTYLRIILVVELLLIGAPTDVFAYIDPGTTGMLSQVLYVLFYGALGLLLYLVRYLKQYVANAKQRIGKLFGRHL
jgi:hypothetical protein